MQPQPAEQPAEAAAAAERPAAAQEKHEGGAAAHGAHAPQPSGRCDDSYMAERVQAVLQRKFFELGKWIARKPIKSMCIGMLVMMSGFPGTFILPGQANLLWVKMAAGFEPFSLVTTRQFEDRDASNALYNNFFVPVHGRNSQIIISPRDPSAMPVFSSAFMKAALEATLSVYNIQSTSGGFAYMFKDLCVPIGNFPFDSAVPYHAYCVSANNDLFSAVQWDASAIPAAGAGVAAYGSGAHDYAGPMSNLEATLSPMGINATGLFRSVVGLQTPTTSGYRFWQPASLIVPFSLRDTRLEADGKVSEPYQQWIQDLEHHILSRSYNNSDLLRITFIADQSIGDGLQSLLNAFIPFLFLVFAAMALYSEIFLFSQTRLKQGEATQILLVLQGLVISGSAGFSGMGWILYLGLNDIVILCCMAVFLVMAVGVDCTFIFVSAMKSADPKASVEEAMGHMLSEGATAISLTTSSSVFCFLVAGLYGASQPAFLKFNLTMSVALTINYLGFIFYFGGCMALNERRIINNRADLMPWKPAKPGKVPEWTDVAKRLREFIVNKYTPLFVTSMPFKLCGLAFALISIGIAGAFVTTIKSGMAQTTFLVDTSHLYNTYADFHDLNGDVNAQVTTAQVTNLDLSSDAALTTFKSAFVDPIRARPSTLWMSCLPVTYLEYRDLTRAANGSVLPWHDWMSGNQLATALFRHYYYPANANQSVGPQTIECTIFYLSNVISKDADPRIETMEAFYSIMEEANAVLPGGASIRLNNFDWAINTSLDDSSLGLCWSGIITAILTVQIVLLFTLPVRRAVITAINILAVVFSVLGFVGYSGNNYHLLTLCVMAMGPGFCVDYTVEVMHFSNLGPATDRMGVKFCKGLSICGYDVFHGCMTGVIGVGCLMLCPGEAPRIFGLVTLVMIVYGGVFALWCLPSILTLIDDLFNRKANVSTSPHQRSAPEAKSPV